MTYNIYNKALEILKTREEFWGEEAHKEGQSYAVTCAALDRAGAYNSAWDALEQFDYSTNLKGEI